MSCPSLTIGCLKQIMTGDSPFNGEPILQLLAYKRITNENGDRYRLLLSDGQYLHSFCVLSLRLNYLMLEGKLTENAIIKVLQHRTPLVHKIGYDNDAGRRILVIFQLEVLKPGHEIDFLIGQPDRVNTDFTNNLSEMVEGLTLRPSNRQQYDADADSIHFREFDELDIFRT